MSAPKHLWSGDWERESAEAARRRAGRTPVRSPEPEPEPEPEPQRPARRAERSPVARPRPRPAAAERPPRPVGERDPRSGAGRAPGDRRQMLRVAGAGVLALLLVAVGAYGLISALSGSSRSAPPAAARPVPWLGVNMETLPINRVMIVAVTPGSPADRAGLGPGDVITAVDSHPVSAPGDVTTAISRLRPGDQVSIQVQRGPLSLTTDVTLQAQPANYP